MTRSHKIDSRKFYIDFYFNGEYPKCKCGCGQDLHDPKGIYNLNHSMRSVKNIKKDFKCKSCPKEYITLISLAKHNTRIHQISYHQFYVDYCLDGVWPTCSCGCGEKIDSLFSYKYQYKVGDKRYIRGHISRVKNNWGHNEEAQKKSKETQREMYESGELVVWNKGETKETNENVKKISEKLKGREITWSHKMKGPKSEEHIKNLKIASDLYFSNPENVEKFRLIGVNLQKYKSKFKFNKLETYFYENFLLKYFDKDDIIWQHWVSKSLVDFYIKSKNCVIEIFGNYWHGNPEMYVESFYINQSKMTVKEIREKDTIRINRIKDDGYKVEIIWEKDLKQKPEKIHELLKSIV